MVVRFENVSKWYPCYQPILGGLKTSLLHLPETLRSLKKGRMRALDGISFEIQRGETVGFVGLNGSGKSTTLALIADVLRPTSGRVEVRGHVSALLELGAGFHPELTGRENIILNGILLGLTRRRVLVKIDEIVAFSELESFLDQPLRTYSSGMIARLGFSVVVHLEPEILVIDEVLAVGDLHFQAKCREKISEFKRRGVTIVLVSHSTEEVRRLCDRVIWLSDGKVVAEGEPRGVLKLYKEAAALRRSPVGQSVGEAEV
jgi:homopolymeric O-antigen transport system ATP-binding protein